MIILLFVIMLFLVVWKVFNQRKVEGEILSPRALRRKKIDFLVKVGIFATISALLYTVPFLQFKLPIFPAFLEFQFSNLPAILGGFTLGPVGGILIVIIKTIPKLPMSSTGFVGELADMVIGMIVVLTSSLIYQKMKTRKGGVIALLAAFGTWVIGAALMNWLVLIDWYALFYFGGEMGPIIGMCKAVVPFINESNFMLVYLSCCCIPFNAVLAIITLFVTFIVYKQISKIFKKDFLK